MRLRASDEKLKAQGRPITSRKAYFIGILSNVAAGAGQSEIDDERIEAEVREQESAAAAKERESRVREAFSRHQSEVFAAELFAIDDAKRDEMIAQFQLSESGVKTSLLWGRGWRPANVGALAVLRAWLVDEKPDVLARLLPNPQDKTLEAWSAWRIDSIA